MKRRQIIAFLLLVVLAACTPQNEGNAVEMRHGTSLPATPSPTLLFVDTLMWQRPDSALTCLLPYFDTCCRDGVHTVSTTHDCHYANLLLAELLYKNDNPQLNRAKLRQAVGYFDSLSLILNDHSHASWRHCGLDPQSLKWDDNIVFLTARAHYINGVGYYERDSVVEACEEYLKALEVMEDRFLEKDLVGHKARFIALTYNRLGDLFSEQFMMESAIVCYGNAFDYCLIEPTSPRGKSKILFRIGKQYDKLGDKEKARDYYMNAIETMPNTDNLDYRDLTSIAALCNYQLGMGAEPSIEILKQILSQADEQGERLTRFLTIGDIYFEEGNFDSALVYLEPVFHERCDLNSQVQASEYLRIIYDSMGNSEKSGECVLFLADHKKSDSENKSLASHLNRLFQTHLDKKQVQQAEINRIKAVKKAMYIFVPFALAVVLAVFLVSKGKSKRIQKEHQETLAMHRRDLMQRDEQLDSLKKEMEQRHLVAEQNRVAFLNEPICRNIINIIGDLKLSTRSSYSDHPSAWISNEDAELLGDAVTKHFPEFKTRLIAIRQKTDWKDLQICYLSLLGLEESQIAVLLQQNPATIYRRINNMKKSFDTSDSLADVLWNLAVDQT